MNERAIWVDYAKGIGIILVVYYHVARGIYNAGIPFPELLFRSVDTTLYSFTMPLFFFLSGLFFSQSFARLGPEKLVLSKIDTIVYPYVIWSILQGSIEVGFSKFTNFNVTFAEVFSLFWQPRAQFWFLFALFLIFTFSTLVYKLTSKTYRLPILVLIALVLYFVENVPEHWSLHFICLNLLFFCFGSVFMKYHAIKYFANFKMLLILCFLFVMGHWLYQFHFSLSVSNHSVWLILLVFTSILFIVSLSKMLSTKNIKSLEILGASSMAIYLMHILAGSSIRVFLQKVLHIDVLLVHLVLGIIVAILLPLLAVVVIEKYKIPYVFSAPISALFKRSKLTASTW